MSGRRFSVVDGAWAICRLEPGAPVPGWAFSAPGFVSVTRTTDELSIVVPESALPHLSFSAERGWSLLKLHGPFAFQEVGILASFCTPLAAAGVSVFAVSTFETDYLLVKTAQLRAATAALATAGHELASGGEAT